YSSTHTPLSTLIPLIYSPLTFHSTHIALLFHSSSLTSGGDLRVHCLQHALAEQALAQPAAVLRDLHVPVPQQLHRHWATAARPPVAALPLRFPRPLIRGTHL
ncbi:hypothetical protein B484DRAFT_426254, partial [Ochromonadaceae sp. CCMP2298]